MSTKKFKMLCCKNAENKIKAEHSKKFKVLGCKKYKIKKVTQWYRNEHKKI